MAAGPCGPANALVFWDAADMRRWLAMTAGGEESARQYVGGDPPRTSLVPRVFGQTAAAAFRQFRGLDLMLLGSP